MAFFRSFLKVLVDKDEKSSVSFQRISSSAEMDVTLNYFTLNLKDATGSRCRQSQLRVPLPLDYKSHAEFQLSNDS